MRHDVTVLDWIDSLSATAVLGLVLTQNALLILVTATVDHGASLRYGHRRLVDRRPPSQMEWVLAVSSMLLISATSMLGYLLWKSGTIEFASVPVWLDAIHLLGFIIFMDLSMFVGHRIGHSPRLYPLVHRFHHRWLEPNGLTLFALHPLEIAGFGGSWLLAISIVDVSWTAVVGFVAVNMAFGVAGHLGVEPLPDQVRRWRLFDVIATPSFHTFHHTDPDTNLGFYLIVWDRLSGTLHPDYLAGRGR